MQPRCILLAEHFEEPVFAMFESCQWPGNAREPIPRALEQSNWNVGGAARALGLSRAK